MAISKLPRKVYQKYRTCKGRFFFGTIIDEVSIKQRSKTQGDYKKMLQLIKKARDGTKEIRLGIMSKTEENQTRTTTGVHRQHFK